METAYNAIKLFILVVVIIVGLQVRSCKPPAEVSKQACENSNEFLFEEHADVVEELERCQKNCYGR